MEEINKLMINKYNSLLNDLLIGYPINNNKVSELMCLLHVLHFLSFEKEDSELQLEILAYYV